MNWLQFQQRTMPERTISPQCGHGSSMLADFNASGVAGATPDDSVFLRS
jgi:hypothetical protein